MNDREEMPDDMDALRLSCAMDGEGTPDELAQTCSDWATSAASRERWHAYHLIGDVLRSSELAGQGRDAAALLALRERLAAEPTQLQPAPTNQPAAAPRRKLSRAWAPVSMAAGVALVAGAAWLNQPTRDVGATASFSLGTRTPDASGAMPVRANAAPTRQFDAYVAAHRQFQTAATLSPTTGYIRAASFDAAASR